MKIVICGNFGAGNLGDEMILQGMLSTLRELRPKDEIFVLSANPEETTKRHQVKSVQKVPTGFRSWIKAITKWDFPGIKAIKDCDLFILGGGGLFASAKFKANIIWGMHVAWASYFYKPVIMYGQSLENLDFWPTKFIVKHSFSESEMIVFRDHQSFKLFEMLEMEEKASVVPDAALSYPIKVDNKHSRTIVVSLRNNSKFEEKHQKRLATFLNRMIAKGYKIRFIEFEKDHDHEIHANVQAHIRDKKKTELMKLDKISEISAHYAMARFAICMPLHATIMAVRNRTPFIALEYAPKVKNFLEYAAISENGVPIKKISVKKLEEHFKKSLKLKLKTDAFLKKNIRLQQNFRKKLAAKLESISNFSVPVE